MINSFQKYISRKQRNILKRFQQADVALHKHFSQVLMKKIADFGQDNMTRAVKELWRLTEQAKKLNVLILTKYSFFALS